MKNKEPKQEALGIAAENNWDKINSQFKDGLNPYAHRVGFIEGAKWQQEQDKNKYSEYMWEAYKASNTVFDNIDSLRAEFEEWFEQFKKK